MAWTVDQSSLGTNTSSGSASTIVLTTTNAVASGAVIVVAIGWFNASVTLTSVTGGSLTWTVRAANNGGVRAAVAYALAPSGLASGSSITANFSGSTGERKIGASSFAGGTDTEQNGTTATGSGTSHSVGPTIVGSDLVVEAASLDTDSGNTQDANSTELLDFAVAGVSRTILQYRVGGTPVGGTWGASAAWSAAGVSLDEGGGGGGPTFRQRKTLFGVGR